MKISDEDRKLIVELWNANPGDKQMDCMRRFAGQTGRPINKTTISMVLREEGANSTRHSKGPRATFGRVRKWPPTPEQCLKQLRATVIDLARQHPGCPITDLAERVWAIEGSKHDLGEIKAILREAGIPVRT